MCWVGKKKLMDDSLIYEEYRDYCFKVGHNPPTFEKWLSIRDTALEFEKVEKPVIPATKRTNEESRGYNLNNQITAAHLYSPYERWESSW